MDALTGVMNALVAYIPNIIAAIVILLVGWLIAVLLRNLVRGVLRRTPLNAWLGQWLGDESGTTPVDAVQRWPCVKPDLPLGLECDFGERMYCPRVNTRALLKP